MKTPRQRKSVHYKPDLPDEDYQAEDAAAISRFFRRGDPAPRSARKTFQLCRQVQETLNGLLSGECGDELLQALYVESVAPAPDASQLLVTVQMLDPHHTVSASEILGRLYVASGWLRSEVAGAITRKRVPQFLFQLSPTQGIQHPPANQEAQHDSAS